MNPILKNDERVLTPSNARLHRGVNPYGRFKAFMARVCRVEGFPYMSRISIMPLIARISAWNIDAKRPTVTGSAPADKYVNIASQAMAARAESGTG